MITEKTITQTDRRILQQQTSFNENLWSAERNIKSLLHCKLRVSWKKKEKGALERDENIVIKLIGLDNEIY